jgi:hypothetical protein
MTSPPQETLLIPFDWKGDSSPLQTSPSFIRTGEMVLRYFQVKRPQCARAFGKFREPGAENFWTTRHCLAPGGNRCARKSIMDGGGAPDQVPDNLLPNGDRVSTTG